MSGLHCQICAVPFNRGRARTLFEPPSAGWGWDQRFAYYDTPRCLVFQTKSGCFEDEDGEHVAGLGCTLESAYSGHRIAVEEMTGMTRPRYIIKKPAQYLEQVNGEGHDDDGVEIAEGGNQDQGETLQDQHNDNDEDEEQEDYERRSEYFVTTQTNVPITARWVNWELERTRFEIGEFEPENFSTWPQDPQDHLGAMPTGIPIHDSCWKIFERVCSARLGAVDLQGFVALYWREACGKCGFQNLTHDAIIHQLQLSGWPHKVGTEYLAANPCHVPGLTLALLESYEGCGNEPFSRVYSTGTSRSELQPKIIHASPDPFSKLPEEMKQMILFQLGPKDVANLRLSSRSFHQLPGRFFRHLIEANMPWFWELNDLDQLDQEYTKSIFSSPRPTLDPNWLIIYQHLRVLQTSMLGVKNRIRVYKAVEEIVARIERLQLEDPEGKYYIEGKGGRLEWVDTFSSTVPQEQNPVNVTHGFDCPRCIQDKVSSVKDWRRRMWYH